jgi:similar to stage IV sporulation protein
MLWTGVSFSAMGGRTEALLQSASEHRLQLRAIRARPGGFTARCTARHYLQLARLARHYRARLHIFRRRGIYFGLRNTLRRAGLWAGLILFGVMLVYAQRLIWHITYVDFTAGQQTRAAAILRENGLVEGAVVRPEMLTLGETALVEKTDEFGWASLNFTGGRLTVEAAPAEPVPAIEQRRYTDICAKTAGTIVLMNVEQGTAAAAVGQTVAAGQVLIAVNRADRQGNPVSGCASGTVQARFLWQYETEQPLTYEASVPSGQVESRWTLLCANRLLHFPAQKSGTVQAPEKENSPLLAPENPQAVTAPAEDTDGAESGTADAGGQAAPKDTALAQTPGEVHQRHGALAFLGLTLPVSFCETSQVMCHTETVTLTETLALDKARLAARRALAEAWPDAEVRTVQETSEVVDGVLHYTVAQQIEANICDNG